MKENTTTQTNKHTYTQTETDTVKLPSICLGRVHRKKNHYFSPAADKIAVACVAVWAQHTLIFNIYHFPLPQNSVPLQRKAPKMRNDDIITKPHSNGPISSNISIKFHQNP